MYTYWIKVKIVFFYLDNISWVSCYVFKYLIYTHIQNDILVNKMISLKAERKMVLVDSNFLFRFRSIIQFSPLCSKDDKAEAEQKMLSTSTIKFTS